ncbi:MAG: lipocalin family protein, partial [Acidiferrobacteraceae bacterium]
SVKGLSWMDREWSTSALAPDEAGWDWFGLQLSDGSDLMFYRLRLENGATDLLSQGSLVDRQGKVTRLTSAEVHIQVLRSWRSPSGGIYPARWRLSIKSMRLTLEVTPVLADQELDVGVRYWEGAVDVRGYRAGHPINGEGYVELTGYAPPFRVHPLRKF